MCRIQIGTYSSSVGANGLSNLQMAFRAFPKARGRASKPNNPVADLVFDARAAEKNWPDHNVTIEHNPHNASKKFIYAKISAVVVINKFSVVVWLCYAEIKHSDWLLQVLWLFLTNQSASFQCSIATLV